MFSQSSVNIPAALILILLAVLQAKVDRETVGQKVVKLTCSPPCWPRGNCYYDWFRDKGWYSSREYAGCSYSASLWLDSTRSSDQGSYTCEVKDYRRPQRNCKLLDQHWAVIYTAGRVCALKGSSVDLSCSYKHPEGLTVTRSLWFIGSQWKFGVEPEDVRESDQYERRVQYSRTLNSCRMTITGLRESDAHTYSFRFYTNDPDGRYSGRPGVTLSVTDLKVTVSDTDGGVKKLNCSSTCTLPNNPTYIWYRNGQPVSECESASCSVAVVSEPVNYSCAVKGSDLHPPPVYNRTSVYAASGGAVVLLLIFTAVFLWMRRRPAVTSSKTEKKSGEGGSAPVYDEVSTLAVTSEPSRAASSDGQDDVQYSSVHFSRSQTKDVPLNSTVHPSNVLPEEEEVQYAAVNTAKPRTARNDETPIYSTVQKNIR